MSDGGAWYNEIEPVSAEWLRRLIKAGLIAPGVVDERDIRDVTPAELSGFTQCHFFAGIGIWSGALRAAGWPDDRPIWTGSCPCQPFSAAGRGDGFADERHLWPHWLWHIAHNKPGVVVGEQVADKDGLGWNDLVSADMGGTGYAFGSVITCAAGFGMEWGRSAYAEWLERALHSCPDPMVARHLRNFAGWAGEALGVGGLHGRHRQYFIGLADEPCGGWRERRDAALARASRYADGGGGPSGQLSDAPGGRGGSGLCDRGPAEQRRLLAPDHGPADPLEHGQRPGLEGLGGDGQAPDQRGRDGGPGPGRSAAAAGGAGQLADDGRRGFQSSDGPGGELEPLGRDAREAGERERGRPDDPAGGASGQLGDHGGGGRDPGEPGDAGSAAGPGGERGDESDRPSGARGPGQADGGRSPFDWLFCTDGAWRATRPGTLPLAHAVAGRVGKLRSYGNGLDFEQATAFCEVAREIADEAGL